MERTFNWQLVNEKSKSLVNTSLKHFEKHQETGEGIPFFFLMLLVALEEEK